MSSDYYPPGVSGAEWYIAGGSAWEIGAEEQYLENISRTFRCGNGSCEGSNPLTPITVVFPTLVRTLLDGTAYEEEEYVCPLCGIDQIYSDSYEYTDEEGVSK